MLGVRAGGDVRGESAKQWMSLFTEIKNVASPMSYSLPATAGSRGPQNKDAGYTATRTLPAETVRWRPPCGRHKTRGGRLH